MVQKVDPRAERKARNAERARLEIIEAAARTFASAGFESTTMRAIAKEAGYTASSLYTYFHSKEAIFEALLERVNCEALEVFSEPMAKSLSFSEKLGILLSRLNAFTVRRKAALLYLHSCSTQPYAAEQMQRGDERFLEGIAKWVGAHSSKKERGGHKIDDVAVFIWGTMFGFFMRWAQTGAPDERLEQMQPTLLNLLLHGLRG